MLILTLVLAATFSAIYIITDSNIKRDINLSLDSQSSGMMRVLQSAGIQAPQNTGNSGSNQQNLRDLFGMPFDYAQSFTVQIDSGGSIVNVWPYINLPVTTYVNVVGAALNSGSDSGKQRFENRLWQYKVVDLTYGQNGQSTQESVYGKQISFLDITDSQNTLTKLLFTLIIIGLISLVALFSVSLYFANRSIRPLKDSWNKQRQFVADASHELKTPIAIIGANIDAIRSKEEETVQSQSKWLDYIQIEIGRMSRLIGNLLYLARSEDAKETEVSFDISSVSDGVVFAMEAAALEKDISIYKQITPNIIVKSNEEKIKQVILILMDNAVKYTNNGGEIRVNLHENKGKVSFSVQNTGSGIEADKLPNIFDRFYRADSSRDTKTGGYGLGLSIAKAIIERSKGNIFAKSENGLTTFSFTLKHASHTLLM
jgi:signal transduction histidine kinase